MSGDLARRQILPALYHLLRDQKLKNFVIIGAAIDDTMAEFIRNSGLEVILLYRPDTKNRVVNIRNAKNDYEFLDEMITFAEKVNPGVAYYDIRDELKAYLNAAYRDNKAEASEQAAILNDVFL